MKKISALIIACSMSLAIHAQIIDSLTSGHNNPATGGLVGYTDTTVLDNSHGAGNGLSFTSSSASGLSANYVGTGTTAEQALFLAPVSSFSTTFAVGDTLWVSLAMPVSTTQMDFGLAVASTATPTAAAAGNPTAWDSRTLTDFAAIYVRPSQTAVRGASSISGTLNTSFVSGTQAANTVSQLYISWASSDVFFLGYVDSSAISHNLFTATFAGTSTIGAAIGFYGDLRATGTSLGTLDNLTITSTIVPEPSTLAMCSMGFAGLIVLLRRKR